MTGRCEAESESFGQCTLPAGHDGIHWVAAEDGEVARLQVENKELVATVDFWVRSARHWRAINTDLLLSLLDGATMSDTLRVRVEEALDVSRASDEPGVTGRPCTHCGGSGDWRGDDCPGCGGSGRSVASRDSEATK